MLCIVLRIMTSFLKNIIKRIPAIQQLINDVERLEKENRKLRGGFKFAPPGHFNSPIPDFETILENEDRFWGELPKSLAGIELNTQAQLEFLEVLKPIFKSNSFPANKSEAFRYYYENPAYGYEDGLYLNAMIRHLKPKKIIEVGSGFSSCLILDTNEKYFNNSIECTFIEPYPDLLENVLQSTDYQSNTILETKLEDVPLEVFSKLNKNDILFIDSSHVSKIGSDVNYLIHEILPRLNSGVFIHIHDIPYPFEYPKKWIEEGRGWNEVYILRAFLQNNNAFKIRLFGSYLKKMHRPFLEKVLPKIVDRGGSIWLEKVDGERG